LSKLWADAPPDIVAEAMRLFPDLVNVATRATWLSFHTFLVRTRSHVILIDTCLGTGKPRPGRPELQHRATPYLENLHALGVAPEQVDFVFCTHLHADHVGWNTQLKDGRCVPTFPNAQYVILRREYQHWLAQSQSADPASFLQGSFADSVLPVVERGQALIVDEADHICDGVRLELYPGHTAGNAIVHLTGSTGAAICSGDVVHSPMQLHFPQLLTRCEDPYLARASRLRLLESIADTPILLLPAHFPDPTACRVLRANGRYGWVFAD
jgi:glyoxylase-like metal-dependent hydrolase (beta-lactamase superfamily II)